MDTIIIGENKKESIKRTGVLLITLIKNSSEEEEALRGISELQLLCETALEGETDSADFYTLTQIKASPEAATYIGSGKVLEAAKLCAEKEISLVVFDTELSPSQIRNNEEVNLAKKGLNILQFQILHIL